MARVPHQLDFGGHVLISGAGVAGPAAAFWFLRAGWRVTLIDVAPRPRAGGYMIDFWGVGFEVVERMGLGPSLRERGYRFGELRLVDAKGRPDARLKVEALTSALGEQYVSILRTDLSDLLLEAVADRIELRFDDEIAALQSLDGKVATRFRRGGSDLFDLVIGADGLHSKVRALNWPESEAWAMPLGYLVAATTVSGYAHGEEGAYVCRTVPGRQVARYRLRDGRTTFFFIFTTSPRVVRTQAWPSRRLCSPTSIATSAGRLARSSPPPKMRRTSISTA